MILRESVRDSFGVLLLDSLEDSFCSLFWNSQGFFLTLDCTIWYSCGSCDGSMEKLSARSRTMLKSIKRMHSNSNPSIVSTIIVIKRHQKTYGDNLWRIPCKKLLKKNVNFQWNHRKNFCQNPWKSLYKKPERV